MVANSLASLVNGSLFSPFAFPAAVIPDLVVSVPGRPLQMRGTFSDCPLSHEHRRYWQCGSVRRLVSCATAAQTYDLSEEETVSWEACREALAPFNFSTEEEDKILGKAFGHVHSPYWSEERKKEAPKSETVMETLDYLRSLSLSDDDLCMLLKKFPEVLGCSIEEELKNNVQVLGKDWGIEGKSLKNLLRRNPKVLGYNVDCKGDCMAKCTRCWVRF